MMAEVFIAAAAETNARAQGLAEALGLLGFKAGAEVPAEAEITKTAEEAKCIVAVWQGAATAPPWLAALAALALERKKLVCVELERDAAPAPFRAAPRIELRERYRDRKAFKARIETLAAEIEKLAPREEKPSAEKIAEAVIKARAALASEQPKKGFRFTVGVVAAAVTALFVVGFGVGRLVSAVRSGELQFTLPSSPSDAAVAATSETTVAERPPLGVTLQELEALPWRDAAAKIDEAAAVRIKADAARGDAMAQTMLCLGHMAGSSDFLPSPAAAREACDAASAQNYPAALYLSWALRRTAPHSGLDEATARARLRAAAERNWLPAQLDYAQLLAGDFRASIADQTTAGRLWLAVAERGDARGQYHYARWLRDSPAGPRDPVVAVPFLERAAEQGLPEALHMLATLHRDGIGVTRDLARARALYERAANADYPPSMFNLAAMIDSGSEADRARAAALYRSLSCMRDERQIQPMASARLRAMRVAPAACN